MTDKKNIHQRLLAIMEDVKGINKGDVKLNNQYRFVTHDSVAKALHDPLVKHGVMMVTSVSDITQDGNRTQVNLLCQFVNVDDQSDFVQVQFPGYGIDPQDKGVGKAISYAYKYCLLKMFCLETGDDVEKDNYEYKAAVEQSKSLEKEGKELLDKFTKTLDTPHAKEIRDYIILVHEKYEIPYQEIISKHNEDPKGFMEKFKKWKEQSISK